MEEEGYGGNNMADLRQFITTASQFTTPPPYQPPQDHQLNLFSSVHHHHHQHHPQPQQLYEMVLMGGRHVIPPPPPTSVLHLHHHHDYHRPDSTITTTTAATNTSATATTATIMVSGSSGDGFDVEAGGGFGGFGVGFCGGDGGGGTGRWPRQETLTLLEIRSRLDHKFKEANQKGPLWDEVSRIMSEEHGYQRSGKKCREKFENLYKYYKKTKEGKAGRQDGKHYRFFRQLEALYGETSQNPIPALDHTRLNPISTLQFHQPPFPSGQFNSNRQEAFQSMSLSNSSSEFDTSSSEDLNGVGSTENGGSSMEMTTKRRRRSGKRSWKAKIKDFIDSQMRKIMEKQEAWLENMMRTLEHREQERILREEEWRKQEAERVEREHRFWAKERAWIEARDKALISALKRLTGKEEVAVGEEHKNLGSRDSHHKEELLLLMNAHQKQQRKEENNNHDGDDGDDDDDRNAGIDGHKWVESEITELMQLKSSMESRFEQCSGGLEEENLWEDIARRMACLGYDRSATMCKEKWDCISNYLSNYTVINGDKDSGKKRKESWRMGSIDCNNAIHQQQRNNETTTTSLYSYGGGGVSVSASPLEMGGGANPMNDGGFRFLLSDGDQNQMWENYGLKLNKGESQ